MTDKTELLPCPFCGCAMAYRVSNANEFACGDHVGRCVFAGHDQILCAKTEWNTRAAPAEDVRAVVDEPVAWRTYRGGAYELFETERAAKADIKQWASIAAPHDDYDHQPKPLYRHPQRPVLMPERKATVGNSDSVNIRNDGWNACIDEFERLNK